MKHPVQFAGYLWHLVYGAELTMVHNGIEKVTKVDDIEYITMVFGLEQYRGIE